VISIADRYHDLGHQDKDFGAGRQPHAKICLAVDPKSRAGEEPDQLSDPAPAFCLRVALIVIVEGMISSDDFFRSLGELNPGR